MASTGSSDREEPAYPQVKKNTADGDESAKKPAETTEIKTKKKKKKIYYEVPQWYVNNVLSYKPPGELKEPEVPEAIIKHDPKLAAQLYMMMADMALYDHYTKDWKLEEQRNFRQQLRTQGRVTSEVEVDEDDDRYYETTDASAAGGRGRRRHRPGVMKKQDGQTRKLN